MRGWGNQVQSLAWSCEGQGTPGQGLPPLGCVSFARSQRACVTNEVGTMKPAGLGIEALITCAGLSDDLCSLTQWMVDTMRGPAH